MLDRADEDPEAPEAAQARANGADEVDMVINLGLAKARQRVQRAELVLQHAKEMLDEDCGVGVNIALVSR